MYISKYNKYYLLFFLILLFIYFWILNNYNKFSKSSLKIPYLVRSRPRILLWTNYFGSNWKKEIDTQLILKTKGCEIIENRSLLSSSDAVVFHWWDIDDKVLPDLKRVGQKWVLYNLEPPPVTERHKFHLLIRNIEQRLDWNMTYRLGSDVYVPYGVVNRCDSQWKLRENLFDSKNRSIAWIVSNCDTHGKREVLVEMLKKYIDVDVFGSCGDHVCNKTGDKCYQMIEHNYKFYLSFEKSVIIINLMIKIF